MHVTTLLERSTLRNPNKIAVIVEDKAYTYKSLLLDSKRVASLLIKEKLVNLASIVFMDKSYETLVSFLGISYARSFYSLINPEFPDYRINSIYEVLEAKVVITNEANFSRASLLFSKSTIYLIEDLLKEEVDDLLIDSFKKTYLDIDPIYCNFTSGSTGVPKGVLISHKNVLDFIQVFANTFNFNENDRFANQAPFDFDVSTKDIYSSLMVGGTLIIVPKIYFSRPKELMDYLATTRPTVLVWAVSALCLITTFHGLDYKNLDSLRMVLFSGEVMPSKHLKIWQDKLASTTFVNLYGPTEITCNVTYHVISRTKDYEKLPIGKAFKNEEIFLIDENNQLIEEANTIGEIVVRGTCVGLGYYKNEEQTKKAFIQNPLQSNYLETVYKTSDLAYFDLEGNYYFSGRKDFQIKYKGHRIELEEIEKHLNEVKGIIRAICLFDSKKERLACIYQGSVTKLEIIKALQTKIPIFMIPNIFIMKDSLPLTKNGKIDRKMLEEELV